MKKGRKINTQKRAIKKVIESSSQGIEKRVIVKRERGITLIALVVTIIIMLILAAVTLNMALGDNGLIQMAKLAANKYEQAAINESLAMQELVNDLNNPGSVAPTTTTTPPPTTTTPSGGGGGTTEGQITADDLNEDTYGNYVDYKVDLNDDGDTTNDWKVFYVGDVPKNVGDGTEEGSGETETRVFLIAADYVPNKCDELWEAQRSEKASMTPSGSDGRNSYNVCCSYWKYSYIPKYHCNDGHNTLLNSEKKQCSFPELFMTTGEFCDKDHHYYCSDHVGETGSDGDINSRCASALQCTGNWSSFVLPEYADYAIGGPTLEMWVASWNQRHGSEIEQDGKTLYADGTGTVGYSVKPLTVGTGYQCHLESTKGYNDTLYFPHNDWSDLDLFEESGTAKGVSEKISMTDEKANCNGYYLSSPSISGAEDLVKVSYLGIILENSYNSINCAVRPVVSLKSNVKFTMKRLERKNSI